MKDSTCALPWRKDGKNREVDRLVTTNSHTIYNELNEKLTYCRHHYAWNCARNFQKYVPLTPQTLSPGR
jgi:hypothetical protein